MNRQRGDGPASSRWPSIAARRLATWIDLEDLLPIDVPARTSAPDASNRDWRDVTVVHSGSILPDASTRLRTKAARLVVTLYVDCVPADQVQQVLASRSDDLTLANTLRRGRRSDSLLCRGLIQLSLPVDQSEDDTAFIDIDRATVISESLATSPMLGVAELLDDDPRVEIRTALQTARRECGSISERIRELEEGDEELSVLELAEAMIETIDGPSRFRSPRNGIGIVRKTEQLLEHDEPEIAHLASFFRADLVETLRAGPVGSALDRFIVSTPNAQGTDAVDVATESAALEMVAIDRVPQGTWPSAHKLVATQQVAVHAATSATPGSITAVNGPPGTGKTTILREIYADVVVTRARAMCGFDDPRDAFTRQARLELDETRPRHWHRPHPSITGFELLVAATSNRAAENITKEIPHAGAVPDTNSITYFSDPANYTPKNRRPDLKRQRTTIEPTERSDELWGLAALVLGSRKNVGAAQNLIGVWDGPDASVDHLGRQSLLSTLNRSADATALDRWREARGRFADAQKRLDHARRERRRSAEAAGDAPSARHHVEQLDLERERLRQRTAAAEAEVDRAAAQTADADHAVRQTTARINDLERVRPSWWQLFSSSARSWRARRSELSNELVVAHRTQDDASVRLDDARQQRRDVTDASHGLETERRHAATRLSDLERRAARFSPERPTPAWFGSEAQEHAHRAAWIDDEFQQLQIDVFAAAMAVHEAFLLAAGSTIAQNLRTWSDLLRNRLLRFDRSVVDALWQTLFLVVPMVSTTFASAPRVLRHVDTALFGCLIIDEAGQARPTEAVGALRRSHRAVIVGDPAQLEPVVTIPEQVVLEVAGEHDLDAPARRRSLSVQDLADGASSVGTQRSGTWIGAPLILHHRCHDPMFSISNRISYEGAMVQGRPPEQGDPYRALGYSRWIDVPHPGDRHFNPADVPELTSLLDRIEADEWNNGLTVGIVSPFRDVVRNLGGPLRKYRRDLRLPFTGDDLDRRLSWATIHTYQGQERDVMIIVLGGATDGAILWACQPPNLLNVAVTRAKDRLYVIGDAARWKERPNASELHRLLADRR